ncbi:hypothetical protein PPL_01371 [Heterostelium album PN500]|uniref:Uncharacterized protein n=1 Tax=Heterostelium pallidum (strain ATCC 26659 / Pp 5 / PN500) TaxID=670386 RepID=D3AZ31_HETP5|nr:hypothetical protein PPL_03493 [Heterostelium album PN500]XP_020437695.1 hypothetical protein PPL_01371 [Heterostelium album PN500]EFA83502.1 hypothetical protein PPL_03493 [Heterostelium album PN500]EFA85588.1 hypothetical protein PPL_01371 [Heterostelium album PN500]|eukprot:XP_020435619.1 hypothetical protein PPL_03493 [Heterostelium album PN500]
MPQQQEQQHEYQIVCHSIKVKRSINNEGTQK